MATTTRSKSSHDTVRVGARRRGLFMSAAGRLWRSPGTRAVAAQVWQAAGSFSVQVLAAHLLGASGLALVSLCLGVIVLATALSSGVVGDSLTVLDRSDPTIRGGLVAWLIILAAAGALVGALAMALTGTLSPLASLAFAAALITFLVEEVVRRTHMALLRFGSLIAIDSVALIGVLLGVGIGVLSGRLSLTTFLIAIAVGQMTGVLAGWAMLPRPERLLRPRDVAQRAAWTSGLRAVGAFGLWRGAQVSLTPLIQTAARAVVVALAGAAVLGHIEAGRIYMAPATLAVQGFGSYLFATYSRRSDVPLSDLNRLATRSAAALSIGAVALGLVAALLAPQLGPLVTGSSFAVDPVIVLGWASVAAATAWLQPFASLAATRGQQRRVFAVRLIDATTTPVALWVGIAWLAMPPAATPYVLAGGLVLAGALVRLVVLRPLRHDQARTPLGEVTDQPGATTIRATRIPTAAVPTVVARDTFGSAGTGRWGTRDLGGSWIHSGSARQWSLSGHRGMIILDGGSGHCARLDIAEADTVATLTVSTDKAPTGGGQYFCVLARHRPGVGDYRLVLRMTSPDEVTAGLSKMLGTTETAVMPAVITPIRYSPGDTLAVRMQVVGSAPTTLSAKVWQSSEAEPADWTITGTDNTASLVEGGSFAIIPYVSRSATDVPVVYAVDNLRVETVRP